MMTPPDPEEVERLCKALAEGLNTAGSWEGRDAISAALTFSYRLATAILTAIPKEDRERQAAVMETGFKKVAGMIALAALESAKERVH